MSIMICFIPWPSSLTLPSINDSYHFVSFNCYAIPEVFTFFLHIFITFWWLKLLKNKRACLNVCQYVYLFMKYIIFII